LIEWVTYRAGAHSTSDDPSKYRPVDESDAWPLGDPIERLRKHLTLRELWDDQRHAAAEEQFSKEMLENFKEAESFGTVDSGNKPSPSDMFLGVYKEMPDHLRRQRQKQGN